MFGIILILIFIGALIGSFVGNITKSLGMRTDSGNNTYSTIGSTTATDVNIATSSWLQVDSSGNLKVTNATLGAGEDLTNDVQKVEQRYSYYATSSLGTVTVKSGSGFLHSFCINNAATGTVSTLYDNTSGAGTVIATITLPATLLQTSICFPYNVSFATGLTLVETGYLSNSYTFSYR